MGLLLLITFWQKRKRMLEKVWLLWRWYHEFSSHLWLGLKNILLLVLLLLSSLLLIPILLLNTNKLLLYQYVFKSIAGKQNQREIFMFRLAYWYTTFCSMHTVHLHWGWLSAAASVLECGPSPIIKQKIESP